jgi:hypothetical protein
LIFISTKSNGSGFNNLFIRLDNRGAVFYLLPQFATALLPEYWILGNRSAAPHLRCHRPAHVQKAHFADLFLAATARLNGYRSEIEPCFFTPGERLRFWEQYPKIFVRKNHRNKAVHLS